VYEHRPSLFAQKFLRALHLADPETQEFSAAGRPTRSFYLPSLPASLNSAKKVATKPSFAERKATRVPPAGTPKVRENAEKWKAICLFRIPLLGWNGIINS
jgi:hypothetical protein